MNKPVIFILIIVALGYFALKNKPVENGKIVYGEARLSFNFPGREIEAVAIGQRYGNRDCSDSSVTQGFLKVCLDGKFCIKKQFECKESVDSQYLKMLDKGSATTHYVHLSHKNQPLQGIVLLWGLTDNESKAVCDKIAERVAGDKGAVVSAQCI